MSTVSAQSAFWAVVALALNTACQPTGSVLSSPAAHSRALRTSPIICVADAIVTLLAFVTLLAQRHGVRDSARAILYWRFHENGVEPEEGAKIEQGWFRALIFVLGALPQMIKVIGLQGVPWTQALCSAYLAPFVVVELLLALAGKERDDFDRAIIQRNYVEKLAKFSRNIGGIVQTGLWIYLLADVLQALTPSPSDATDANNVDDRVVIAIVPFLVMIYTLFMLLIWGGCLIVGILLDPLVRLRLKTTSSSPGYAVTCFAMAVGSIWWMCEIIPIHERAAANMYSLVSPGYWMWSIILIGILGMLSVLISDIASHRMQRIKASRLFFTPSNWPGVFEPLFFFLMNAATLLLYHLYLYQPQGTVKPAWTEWLG
ncbi:hypothetical protein MMC27_007143 [Xylographa pallens]|nr:hypothetical protein [Xylographa pallens]